MENNQTPNQVQYPQPMANDRPLSIGEYIVMMIVGAIPLVGLIMMFVWGFSGNSNTNRKNYARAMLIMMAIGIVLSIIFSASIMAALGSIAAAGR
ncbi:hypothetical protein [Caproiciproducens sp. LBM24188]